MKNCLDKRQRTPMDTTTNNSISKKKSNHKFIARFSTKLRSHKKPRNKHMAKFLATNISR